MQGQAVATPARWLRELTRLWSTTDFQDRELSSYACAFMVRETRTGVLTLSLVFLLLLLGGALSQKALELGPTFLYTTAALSVLCVHVFLASLKLWDLRSLQLLAMTLLIVGGTAFVLLAHQTGQLGAVLFTSSALLFMLVPLVPWGLREGAAVTALLYAVFASSSWAVAAEFDPQTFWALQTLMLGVGMVSLTHVGRSVDLRRNDIRARFELEQARQQVETQSLQDPLTGLWNRRFLEREFDNYAALLKRRGSTLRFALLDVDHFKQVNDRFGHAFGDSVLRWLAEGLQERLAGGGFAIRVGGDEFVLVFAEDEPEAVLEGAVELARTRASEVDAHAGSEISVSVGLFEAPPDQPISLERAYLLADEALFRSKSTRVEPDRSYHFERAVQVQTARAQDCE